MTGSGLSILSFPDPILDSVCAEAKFDAETTALVQTLVDHVIDPENGAAGLAAPQIGVLKRVTAMRIGVGVTAMINPVIKWRGPLTSKQLEGCLSLPGQHFTVMRSHVITVEFYTPVGTKVLKRYEGWDARVVQHEIDHLDGRLICHVGVLFDG